MFSKISALPRAMIVRAAALAMGVAVAIAASTGSAGSVVLGDVAGTQGAAVTVDDRLASVARSVEGFGGVFATEDGKTLNLYLVRRDPEAAAEALSRLATLFGEYLPQSAVRIRKARYSFLQLKEWYDRMTMRVFRIPGVTLSDIDDAKNRITVGVEKLETRGAVEAVLARLDIPREAVDIVQAGPFEEDASLQDEHRPLVGGLGIAITGETDGPGCTLGFNARRLFIIDGFVTASHCTSEPGIFKPPPPPPPPPPPIVEGTVFFQEKDAPGKRVGVESSDPRSFAGGVCPVGEQCRYSDSAFATRDNSVTGDLGLIARPASGAGPVWPVPPRNLFRIVAEAKSTVVGGVVAKIGRVTGRTNGKVLRICANIPTRGIFFLCQNTADYTSADGDSGAPVISVRKFGMGNPMEAELKGIHWGASRSEGVFSPIAGVERDLGPLNTCAPPFVC